MFMTTTFGHYQLPVQQLAPVGVATEAGADSRSALSRPTEVLAPQTELPRTETIRPPEKTTLPFEFKQWLQRLQGYERGAEQGKAAASTAETIAERIAEVTAVEPEAQQRPAEAVDGAAQADASAEDEAAAEAAAASKAAEAEDSRAG